LLKPNSSGGKEGGLPGGDRRDISNGVKKGTAQGKEYEGRQTSKKVKEGIQRTQHKTEKGGRKREKCGGGRILGTQLILLGGGVLEKEGEQPRG